MILPSSCSLYLQSLCATNITLNTFQHHSTPFNTIQHLHPRHPRHPHHPHHPHPHQTPRLVKSVLGAGVSTGDDDTAGEQHLVVRWRGPMLNWVGMSMDWLCWEKISPETMVSTINSIGASGFNVPIIQFCVFFFFVRWLIDVGMQTAYRFTMIYLLILLTPTAHILAQPFQLLACSFKPQPNKTCLRQGCCFQVTGIPNGKRLNPNF